MTLDNKLIWNEQIKNLQQKVEKSKKHPVSLTKQKFPTLHKNKTHTLTQFIRPIILYSCPAWCFASHTQIKKIQTLQNKILRLIVNSPRYVQNSTIHRDLKIPTITDLLIYETSKLYNKATTHPNPSLRSATDYNPYLIKKHKRPLKKQEKKD